jgi:hypothetical protein
VQLRQDADPARGAYVSLGHAVHVELFAAAENVPAEQFWHDVATEMIFVKNRVLAVTVVLLPYVPAAHAVQEDTPDAFEKVPSSHTEHAVAFPAGAYMPGGHVRHSVRGTDVVSSSTRFPSWSYKVYMGLGCANELTLNVYSPAEHLLHSVIPYASAYVPALQ